MVVSIASLTNQVQTGNISASIEVISSPRGHLVDITAITNDADKQLICFVEIGWETDIRGSRNRKGSYIVLK